MATARELIDVQLTEASGGLKPGPITILFEDMEKLLMKAYRLADDSRSSTLTKAIGDLREKFDDTMDLVITAEGKSRR